MMSPADAASAASAASAAFVPPAVIPWRLNSVADDLDEDEDEDDDEDDGDTDVWLDAPDGAVRAQTVPPVEIPWSPDAAPAPAPAPAPAQDAAVVNWAVPEEREQVRAASPAAYVPGDTLHMRIDVGDAASDAEDAATGMWPVDAGSAAAVERGDVAATLAGASIGIDVTRAWDLRADERAPAGARDTDVTLPPIPPTSQPAQPVPPAPSVPAAQAMDATWSHEGAFGRHAPGQSGAGAGAADQAHATVPAASATAGATAAAVVVGYGGVELPGFGARRDREPEQGQEPTADGAGIGAAPDRAWDLAYAPIPGPADRESFFDAQRRYRRQTWRQTLVCAIAAVVAGVPLSLILTPFIYFGTGMLAWLVNLVLPVPDRVWDGYRWVGSVMLRIVDEIEARDSSSLPPGETVRTGIPWDVILPAAAVWLLPGIVAMLLIWPALRALLRHGGVGGVLLAVSARAPRMDDLEERQLVNVVAEMALAAGLPAPQVALIDAPIANAAAIGTGPQDATILVSRSLLDELDRDETSAVLGHLVASIGNGDLSAALSIVAIFQTFGFASALVRMPASRLARQTVWRVLRLALFRRGRADEAHAVAAMLSRGVLDDAATDDLVAGMELPVEPKPRPGIPLQTVMLFPITGIAWFILATIGGLPGPLVRLGLIALVGAALAILWYQRVYLIWVVSTVLKSFKVLFMLPYFLGVFMPQLLLSMTISFLLEPMVALVWRTRRYLADATAVQLTRDPQSLAEGLSGLVSRGATIPGGAWAGPYFVVGGDVSNAHQSAKLLAEVEARVSEARTQRGIDKLSGVQRRVAEGQLQLEMRSQVVQQHYGTGAVGAAAARAAAEDEAAAGSGAGAGGNTFSGDIHGVANLHPPLAKRLKRLRRYGATLDLDAPKMPGGAGGAGRLRGMGLLWLPVLAVLMVLLAVLMTVLVVLLTAISLAATGLLMLAAYGVLSALTPV